MSAFTQELDTVLAAESIQLNYNESELKHIPADKPAVLLARHLFGELDPVLMLQLMLQKNPRSKIITFYENPYADRFPEYFITVDLDGDKPISELLKMKSTLNQHLEQGGIVGLFPARRRFFTKKKDRFLDTKWEPAMTRLINNMKLPVIPIDFQRIKKTKDAPSDGPQLVTARVGSPISVPEQESFKTVNRLTKFLRARTLALGTPIDVKQFYFPSIVKIDAKHQIAPPIADELIHKEMAAIKDLGQLLFTQSEFEVYYARARQVPNCMLEIGRLREITFRAVDEGSNKPRDMDEYDIYYTQLIIYDKEAQRIIGGYRIGRGDNIYTAYGIKGFYIASLFKFKKKFGKYLSQAAELGRAYIIPEYQKKRLPLFLLWRGILGFLLENPQYKYLIGPLSISQQYSDISKQVIIEFIKQNYYDEELASYVKPRKPFKVKQKDVDVDIILENLQGEISKLDNFIEDIEPKHFRIPVLMKKYIKQNARIISFNVDPKFSDTLDGLMILNIAELPQETIEALKKDS